MNDQELAKSLVMALKQKTFGVEGCIVYCHVNRKVY